VPAVRAIICVIRVTDINALRILLDGLARNQRSDIRLLVAERTSSDAM